MEEELRRLIKKFTLYICTTALVRLKDPEDVDEVVQDVFYKLSKYLFLFRGKTDDDIKRWIYKVTINRVKNYNRSFFRRNTEELKEDIVSKNTIEDFIIFKENIENLTDTYRDAVTLQVEGYTIKEISKMLNLSEDVVKKRLSRAKKIMKDDYYKEGMVSK